MSVTVVPDCWRLVDGFALNVLVFILLLRSAPTLFDKLVWLRCAVELFGWWAPGSGEVSTMTRLWPFMVFMPVNIDFF